MLKQKKGVSPLIATVLLIAFAVALGAVVMNWGKSFAIGTMDKVQDKSDQDTTCSGDVSLNVVKLADGTLQMCYGGGGTEGYIFFIIENTGRVAINQIDMQVIGSSDVYANTTLNGTSIEIGHALRKNLTYSYTSYGDIRQVRVIPKIDLGGKIVTCSGNVLEKDTTEILNCTSI
ncbi:MAG: archaellin/type IV pilin N-terminal domain-containing protein [Candidatus Woesearchaeota archaeon]